MPDLAETINANTRAHRPPSGTRVTPGVSHAESLSEIPEAASWIEVDGIREDGHMGSSFCGPDAKADAIEWATDNLIELGKIDYTVGDHGAPI